jgi:monoamine oxidase
VTLVLNPPTRVAVIGAGLAGLSAAHRLRAEAAEVVVYEARDRVGGRAETVTDGLQAGQHGDLGPELVLPGYRVLPQLCAELGVELSEQVSFDRADAQPDETVLEGMLESGRVIVDDVLIEGERFDALHQEIRAALSRTPATAHEVLAQWMRRAHLSPDARGAVTGVARMISGGNLNEFDGHYIFDRTWGGVRRVLGGTQRLAEALADGLDLRLVTPVRAIRQASGVFVTTEDGDTDRFDRVIVTPPFHVLATIGFDPPLEPARLAALNAFQPALGGKVVTQYAEGDAVRAALTHCCFTDGEVHALWVSNPYVTEGPAVVTGFVGGRNRSLLESPGTALERQDEFVSLAVKSRVTRIGGVVKNWANDRWTLGTTTSPGVSQLGELIPRAAQAFNRLHFAGDYTELAFTGSMEGAVRSGIRAADEVLRRPTRIPLPEIDGRLVRR